MDGNLAQSRVEERKFMDAYSNYLIVDPETAQFGSDKETLVNEAKKRFMSLFQKEPEEVFWCWGYEVAEYGSGLPRRTWSRLC